MADIRNKLSSKFNKNIFNNFGSFLRILELDTFRGLKDKIVFDFPITAISGSNGAGKSTIGQIAICGYKSPPDTSGKRYYVKDFFPQSTSLDPNPFTPSAKAIYHYAVKGNDNGQPLQQLTVSRKNVEWSGYKRQPLRDTYYVGITAYLPRIEMKSKQFKDSQLVLTDVRNFQPEVADKVSSILNSSYDNVWYQQVNYYSKLQEIGMLERFGYSYSEHNMGFGEGRLLYLVDLLENAKDYSLFVMEEPETSLHGDAQYRFMKYLMDVCYRKGHQIILSTHSSTICDALPPEGRILVTRDENGARIIPCVSSYTIRSVLSDGRDKTFTICVEDEFAKILLTEIIRRNEPGMLRSIHIAAVGDKKAVREVKTYLDNLGKHAIAVRDADTGENSEKGLFSFPGKLPPEKEVFYCDEVDKYFKDLYGSSPATLFKIESISNHHDYSKVYSEKVFAQKDVIEALAIEKYMDVMGAEYFQPLFKIIKTEHDR